MAFVVSLLGGARLSAPSIAGKRVAYGVTRAAASLARPSGAAVARVAGVWSADAASRSGVAQWRLMHTGTPLRASDDEFNEAGTGQGAADFSSSLGGDGLGDGAEEGSWERQIEDLELDAEDMAALERGEMPNRMLYKQVQGEWDKVWPDDGSELPSPTKLPPSTDMPETTSDIPTKEEYIRKTFVQETDGFRMPRTKPANLNKLSEEDREAYEAAVQEDELAAVKDRVEGSWRLDKIRAREMPLWMKYEAVASDDEDGDDDDLGVDQITDIKSVVRWPMRDMKGRAYATGKRKTSVARVWIKEGDGNFTVNGVSLADYFHRTSLRAAALHPFVITQTCGAFDVWLTVKGGGLSGQAGAIRHGVAKALARYDPFFRSILKTEKLLRRDPRMVERKKPGQKKARKKFQWVKR